MWSAMTDYDKVANDTLSKWNAHMTTQLMPKFGAAIAEALRTAVEKEREENIKIVRDMDNRLYGDTCMTAKFQKDIEKAIFNRGKDTPQNG